MRKLWMLFAALTLCSSVAQAQSRDWSEVRSFAYQLQDLDLEEAAASPFDLLVIDYSLHGDEASRLNPQQVELLKRKPDGSRRYVLAYLSIGEAEEYRFYWQPQYRPGDPDWLGRPNPDWPDNYPVLFWKPDWKAIVFSYLDKVIEAGFDGVYLDRVDVYEQYPNRPQAAEDMKTFVTELADYARRQAGGDFGIFPQNADELLDDPDYLATITGVGREDTYYGYPESSKPSREEWTKERERNLDRAKAAGKLVLNVDYTARPEQVRQAHTRAEEKGYLEYVADRPLARLEIARNQPTPVEEPPQPTAPPRDLPLWPAALLVLGLLFLVLIARSRRRP